MKKLYLLTFLFSFLFLTSCITEEDDTEAYDPQFTGNTPVNSTSIIPSSTGGRSNVKQGCVQTDSRTARISLWDHGTIDGDIVSLYLNDRIVVSEITLDGPNNKYTVDVTLENNGFNYVTLYAHNLGDISPNTAAISINGEQFTLESNLQTNGAFDVVVTGYGGSCSDSGSGNTGGGNTGSTKGKIAFYTTSDLGCGNITVTVDASSTQVISTYYPSGINDCSQGAIFNLSPGTHSYKASCSSYTWEDTFTVTENGCLRYQLR